MKGIHVRAQSCPCYSESLQNPPAADSVMLNLREIILLFKAFIIELFSAALHSLGSQALPLQHPCDVHEYNPAGAGGVILLHKIFITFNCFSGMEASSQI